MNEYILKKDEIEYSTERNEDGSFKEIIAISKENLSKELDTIQFQIIGKSDEEMENMEWKIRKKN